VKKWQKMDFSLLRKTNFQKAISGDLLKTFPFSSNKMSQDVKSKIENLYKKTKISATYNKVNKSNLFVTVFAFTPASKKDPAGLKPGYAHLPPHKLCNRNSCSGSVPVCTAMLHHRLRTSSCTVTVSWSPAGFVPRSRLPGTNLYLDGKNTCHASLPTALENS
jgi:hypothetical protein